MSFTSIEDAHRMAFAEKKRKQGGDVMGTLTLRDYFAAKALNGLLAGTLTPDSLWSQDEVAETAYNMADAMLKAREA